MIGTTRFMTDNLGSSTEPATYTAFGEQRGGSARRYGYAGAYGYQTATSDTPGDPYADFPFQHVGARYYDPSSGRFLQRDPIGIKGGLNVYAYVLNRPAAGVDPTGKGLWSLIGGTVGGIVGGYLVVITSPVWVTVVGVAIVVVSIIVVIDEIIGIWPSAKRIVKPIRKPVKRRNRAVDNAIDCSGMGMEPD